VNGAPVFVTRMIGLEILTNDGAPVGRLVDVVVGYPGPDMPPPVLGLVAAVQRRQIFVNANRIAEIDAGGVRLHSGTVDLQRFRLRDGERLVSSDILERRVGREIVNDLALRPSPNGTRAWEVSGVSMASPGVLRRRRTGRLTGWDTVREFFGGVDLVTQQVSELREMHPADAATQMSTMEEEERHAVADAMNDEDLADLLVELPEDEAAAMIEHLDSERAADVLEEMDIDDAVDVLAELAPTKREEVLADMDPEESAEIRRLLAYLPDTAGGLMNPNPLIFAADATVAEALARIRNPDLPAAEAAHVFVCEAPHETPTGRYLGPVGYQRLLREPPATPLGRCLDNQPEFVLPDLATAEIARRLASYDVVAVPVCDAQGRLLGAVSVDDVLDHLLPDGWRRR
jgi:flagellar motility protein MotE (MotC chaperone)